VLEDDLDLGNGLSDPVVGEDIPPLGKLGVGNGGTLHNGLVIPKEVNFFFK